MRHPIRLIDAAANRASEAARTLEDLARFCADDESLTAGYKTLRHQLVSILGALDLGWREAHRDLAGDVGTTIEGFHEGSRASVAAIAAANGSRLTEALRSLEEGLKLFPRETPLWAAVETLRYGAYTLNAQLALRLQSTAARQWRVCVLLTQSLCLRPWRAVLTAALAAGADCIQIREKEMSSAECVAHARVVVEQAHRTGASVIVNDRIDIALAAGADGVHLGLSDLAIQDARRIAGRALLIGATAHNAAEARAAIQSGADYCGVGAMFPSLVKPNQPAAGPPWMRQFSVAWPTVPHLAIGGITPENARQLQAVGCRGVAVATSVCGAEDPGVQVALLAEMFDTVSRESVA
ncbi:MAG: thiamine phosphate synthase [Phycisphaerales bacterium]|nr:thiamine phosphate synthase [Phycisphaerales bacterium]